MFIDTSSSRSIRFPLFFILLTLALLGGSLYARQKLAAAFDQPGQSYIVQAVDMDTAAQAIIRVNGEITHELEIIDAVSADLRPFQLTRLQWNRDVQLVFPDIGVGKTDTADLGIYYPPWLSAKTNLLGLTLTRSPHATGAGKTSTTCQQERSIWAFSKSTFSLRRELFLAQRLR